jgi:hypothetical protein
VGWGGVGWGVGWGNVGQGRKTVVGRVEVEWGRVGFSRLSS